MFRTLDAFDTEYSADSVEWCPVNSFKDIFVCGTYELTKTEETSEDARKNSKRLGRIYLLRAVNNGRVKLLQQLNAPAVLDMKWANVSWEDKIFLGVVNSMGYLQIYQLSGIEDSEKLEFIMERKVIDEKDDEEVLALSLDWSSGRWTKDSKLNLQVVVSDSRGYVRLFEMHEKELEEIFSCHSHSFEAWIAAFDYWDTNVLFSGGDDCKFHRFDVRSGSNPVETNRIHGAGVTSIHSNASKLNIIASGSYDETLRLWDSRHFKRPLSETNLGGGIWRLKWDPFERRYLLAACMYGGFRVIDCENTEKPCIVGEYMEHESISYGCDWSHLSPPEIPDGVIQKKDRNIALVGTCSFYDHILKLSAVRLEEDQEIDVQEDQ